MLLVIGLDGATWDLLDPWIEQGRLPHLARLRAQGAWGPLASTMPPATLPSWATFMTGVNPGKHGIFDFTRRQFGTYEVRFVNSTFRKSPTVWRLLSDCGRRVCVLGVPGTYPPESVNGCMISGFDTPVTTRADASFITPAELAPLVKAVGGFPFADFQEFRLDRNWHRRALGRLLRGVEIKTRLARTLLSRDSWDCFMVLFGESDTVAHHFWRFHDTQSPRFDAAGAHEFGDAIRRVYEALDAAVGLLTELVPQATVLVASDHGFGGTSRKAVYLNQWLREQGLQSAEQQRPSTHIAGRVKRTALRVLPPGLQARAFRLNGGRWASRLESRARFAGINWAHTRAFSEELNYFPSVWLNLKGREPGGVVHPSDYDRVCADVCAAAAGLRDPEHQQAIVRRAWRREELYHGPWVQYAPDVVLEFNLDRSYSYACLPTAETRIPGAVQVLDEAACSGGKLAGMNGSHREAGIFLLANAPCGCRGYRGDIQIADMAPTILAVCEVEPPAEFDGRTVAAVVRPKGESAAERPVLERAERVYDAAAEGEIAARLVDLGYLQ